MSNTQTYNGSMKGEKFGADGEYWTIQSLDHRAICLNGTTNPWHDVYTLVSDTGRQCEIAIKQMGFCNRRMAIQSRLVKKLEGGQ